MSGHYCKRAEGRVYPDGCMMQCVECGAFEARHLIAHYEHSRKPVGCNETGQTEPKGLDCAASQISVSGTNLERELNALMKDAKRYRWIREHWGVSYHFEDSDMKGENLDAAVDEAMDEALLPKSQRWP